MTKSQASLLLPAASKYALCSALLIVCTIAWVASLRAMTAVPMSIPGFVAAWTVMMVAMMLPAELPATRLFATVAQSRTRFGFPAAPTAMFIGGYFGVWIVTGVGVALVDGASPLMMHAWEPVLVGGALSMSGVYQFTRWKGACLGHCRAPLHFFMEHWRDGLLGATRMGAHHGMYCLGCCWGLMLALVALGLMNPVWMIAMALLICAEKALPRGERLTLFIGAALLFGGVGVAFGWIRLPPTTGGM